MTRRFAGCAGHCSGCGVVNTGKHRCCAKCRRKARDYFRNKRTAPKLDRITEPWPKNLAHEVNSLPSRL